MKKHCFLIYTVVLAACLLVACSTKRDGVAARIYHNTTTHFNGHFNAGESIKKGIAKIEAAQKEDFDEILPIFINGDEETAKSAYPEMERAIEKCEKVINKHTLKNEGKKVRKHPGFNKWIDENYMIIGQSYFYKKNYRKAEEVFQFVSRKYKEKETVATSNTWLARTLIERKDYTKALQVLNRIETDDDLDEKLKADYYLVFADLYIHQGKFQEATEKLELALKNIKRKKNRARPHFILAQIYQHINKSPEAQREYDEVINSRPPYELEFYARINKALAYNRRGGSSDEIKKQLKKMLRDEKNLTYRDQIYYALGDIAIEEQNRPEAIYYFEQSLEANVDNRRQKSKTFLRLADLYFDQREYEAAQSQYDSTLKNITEEHKRYIEIKARAESLTDLVNYLNLIATNDSLLTLCGKSEAEREKSLRSARARIEREMEEKRAEDEARAAKQQEQQATGISGTFWCYNKEARQRGHDNFLKVWDDRPLKDYWRLESRLATAFGTQDESQVTAAVETTKDPNEPEVDPYKVPTLDELRAQLPCDDDSKITAAQAATAEAYYQSGIIYKEKLDDDDNAISSWEQLVTNIEESDFHPVALYQLFRTWLSKEQIENYQGNPLCTTCNSEFWGERIKERYPESEWARLVDNPEYHDIKEMNESAEKEAYEIVYRLYTDHNYPAAITACTKVITSEPDNHLICKYRLLKAICVGYSDAVYGMKDNYLKELNEVKKNCGSADEGKRADELYRAANNEGASSELTATDKVDESTGNDGQISTEVKPESDYIFNDAMEHYFAIIIPIQGSDINKTKAQIADFNTEFYASAGLKVTNNLLDKNNHIALVKPFKTIAEAKDYMATFITDKTKLSDLNSGDLTHFLISKQNYIALFKNKNLSTYLEFYNAHY